MKKNLKEPMMVEMVEIKDAKTQIVEAEDDEHNLANDALVMIKKMDVWGKDINKYDLVEQVSLISFQQLQFYRLVAFLVNFFFCLTYFYIYLKNSLGYLNFVASFLTTAGFATLFIGSGKQVVYHQMVDDQGGQKDAKPKETKLWILGLWFYSQAIPFVITSNFMYYVNFRFLSTEYFDEAITCNDPSRQNKWYCKYYWLQQLVNALSSNMQTMAVDQQKIMQYRYYRKYNEDHEKSMKEDFRERWLVYLQLVPAVTLAIDMLFNKLRFKAKNYKATLMLMVFFVYSSTNYSKETGPLYPENLNINLFNISYSKLHQIRTSPSDNTIEYGDIYMKEFNKTSCAEQEADIGFVQRLNIDWTCEDFWQNYYVLTSNTAINQDNQWRDTQVAKQEWNIWTNWGLTVILLFLVSIISFFVSWMIHNKKAKSAQPWNSNTLKDSEETGSAPIWSNLTDKISKKQESYNDTDKKTEVDDKANDEFIKRANEISQKKTMAHDAEKVRLEREAEKVRIEKEAEKVRLEREAEKVRLEREAEKVRLEKKAQEEEALKLQATMELEAKKAQEANDRVEQDLFESQQDDLIAQSDKIATDEEAKLQMIEQIKQYEAKKQQKLVSSESAEIIEPKEENDTDLGNN